MYNVTYSFRKHRYDVVPGGPLTLDEAERCKADKVKGLKVHTETHHRQKIAELRAFLTETFRRLESIVELGPPDNFYNDYERLATTAAVRVLRFGCTIIVNEPSTPIEALRLIGRLLAWCDDIISRERPMKVSEVAERLHVGVKKVYALIRKGELPGIRIQRSWRVDPIELENYIKR